MTVGQITQAVALELSAAAPPAAQVTQAVALALGGPAPNAYVTHATTLSLVEQQAAMRVTQAVTLVMVKDYPRFSTQTVQCWKITRKDGQVFAYTTHDRDLTFMGTTYRRCASVKASAISSTANSGAQTGDVQITGLLNDAGISQRDLYVGLFDDAKVEVWKVDWRTRTGRILTRGIMQRSVLKEGSYQMTALTGGARMQQQPLLDVFSALCRVEFGGSACGVNAEALRVSGTVTAIPARNIVNMAQRRIFTDSGRVEPAGTFDNGRLTWLTGLNAGLTVEVKDVVACVTTLWQPLPADVAAGDTYTMIPGCGKRFAEDCIARFNNGANFRGFPHLPGNDAINLTPDRN